MQNNYQIYTKMEKSATYLSSVKKFGKKYCALSELSHHEISFDIGVVEGSSTLKTFEQ